MALVSIRATFARLSSMGTQLGRQAPPLNSSKMAAVAPIQVATLKATYGGKYPYAKPYPYKERSYTLMHEWFDRTGDRLNENSKIIVVEGNLAVGKNSFAKRLAASFDLYYLPSVQNEDVYRLPDNGFDLREMNQFLPSTAQFNDLQRLYNDLAFAKSGEIGRMQIYWYSRKFLDYAHALHHLLSTGQGVVLARSVYSDNVFVDAMKEMGYITKNFHKWYYVLRDNSICELLKPHLTIYLDAPIPVLKERIKKRGYPFEQNSPGLNDTYLKTLDKMYKNRFLPKMRESGQVVEIDWAEVADDMDFEVIVEELQNLRLEAEDSEDTRCKDWHNVVEDQLCHYRKIFGSRNKMEWLLNVPEPKDCPEVLIREDDQPEVMRFMENHPALKYQPGFAPELGHGTLFKI